MMYFLLLLFVAAKRLIYLAKEANAFITELRNPESNIRFLVAKAYHPIKHFLCDTPQGIKFKKKLLALALAFNAYMALFFALLTIVCAINIFELMHIAGRLGIANPKFLIIILLAPICAFALAFELRNLKAHRAALQRDWQKATVVQKIQSSSIFAGLVGLTLLA